MKLFLATGNRHKLAEVGAILAACGWTGEWGDASEVGGMPPVEEDANTFAGNARKKARALAARLPDGAWALADDSGLCVDALDGAPGVRSARFAGAGAGDAANTRKLLDLLTHVPVGRRTAAFHCSLAVASSSKNVIAVFDGRCPGRIIDAPCGSGGFGYDPVFVPDGHDQTFAELPAEVKNRISHRARALARFVEWWRSGAA